MKGFLSRAGRKPRPTYPDPKEILLGQLSDEQRSGLLTKGRFEVQGASNAYEVRYDGIVPGWCVGIEAEWWDDYDEEHHDYDYYEYARVLAVKQLIESNEYLFLRVANKPGSTRPRAKGESDAEDNLPF